MQTVVQHSSHWGAFQVEVESGRIVATRRC
jgi:hypothetical protein